MASNFQVTGIIETSTMNDPKWPWILHSQRYPLWRLLVTTSPKFQPILLYDKPRGQTFFELQAILRQVH